MGFTTNQAGNVPGGVPVNDQVPGQPSGPTIDIAILKEAPLNPLAYGAVGDGVTDDTAVLERVLGMLPPQGGELLIASQFVCSSPLVLDGLRSTILQGIGGISAGATPRSQIIFTQSGAASALSCRSTYGVALRDVSVLATNAGFTGTLVDFSHGALATDSAYMTVERCLLQGPAACPQLLDLNQAIIGSFETVLFTGPAARAVRGMAGAAYSNSHAFRACTFVGQTNAPILSPGQGWSFVDGCTWEALAGGNAGAIAWAASTKPLGLVVAGCWFGDAVNVTAGNWIDFETAGGGISIRGNYFGGGAACVLIGAPGLAGVEIVGNKMDQCLFGVNVQANAAVNGLWVMNDDSTCATSGVSLGASAVARGLVMDGKAGTVTKSGGF